jgi:hypothetical protein
MMAECKECGKEFKRKSSRHKFCCTKHKKKFHNRKRDELRKQKELPKIKCKECGGTFTPKRVGNFFCNPKCCAKFNSRKKNKILREERAKKLQWVNCKECNTLFKQKSTNQIFCHTDCSSAWHNKNKPETDFIKTPFKETECLCPLCEIKYTRFMYWTGRGIPRKHCPDCLRIIKEGYGHYYQEEA